MYVVVTFLTPTFSIFFFPGCLFQYTRPLLVKRTYRACPNTRHRHTKKRIQGISVLLEGLEPGSLVFEATAADKVSCFLGVLAKSYGVGL